MQIELFHDLAAMRVHRIHAEIQPGGDLFVGLAFGDQLQHLALAVGEQIDRIRDILPEIAQQRSRNFGADIAIAPRDRTHRIQQFRINRIFQNVAARSGLENFPHINRLFMHAERQHPDAGIGFTMRRVASTPPTSGMATSISTTSGLSFCARSMASRPLAASPITSISECAERMSFNPCRTMVWSSASRTFIARSGTSLRFSLPCPAPFRARTLRRNREPASPSLPSPARRLPCAPRDRIRGHYPEW